MERFSAVYIHICGEAQAKARPQKAAKRMEEDGVESGESLKDQTLKWKDASCKDTRIFKLTVADLFTHAGCNETTPDHACGNVNAAPKWVVVGFTEFQYILKYCSSLFIAWN